MILSANELLHLVSENTCETVAYVPPVWSSCQAISEDGTLVLMGDEAIYGIAALHLTSRPLQVACSGLESWMEQGFAQTYPNIPVKHRQVYEHKVMNLFTEQIAIQSDEIDIFEILRAARPVADHSRNNGWVLAVFSADGDAQRHDCGCYWENRAVLARI